MQTIIANTLLTLWHMHRPNWIVISEKEEQFCAQHAGKLPIIYGMMFAILLASTHQVSLGLWLVWCRFLEHQSWAGSWSVLLCAMLYYRWEETDPHIGIDHMHLWNNTANKKNHRCSSGKRIGLRNLIILPWMSVMQMSFLTTAILSCCFLY